MLIEEKYGVTLTPIKIYRESITYINGEMVDELMDERSLVCSLNDGSGTRVDVTRN